jgi:tRNA threonylcarbamoyladenosine biosynthesis protein TsaE
MNETRNIRTSSETQTVNLGCAIGGMLRPGDVVLLEGQLGSGKTRMAKGIVSSATGVPPEEVVSPTFTLINSFEGTFPVHHADLYRIGGEQVEGIGLEDVLDEGGALVVEWAERLGPLEDDHLTVVLLYGQEERERNIVLSAPRGGSWAIRIKLLHEPSDSLEKISCP